MNRYIVGFRSTRAAGSTSVDLYEADRLAHEEAVTVRIFPDTLAMPAIIERSFSIPS